MTSNIINEVIRSHGNVALAAERLAIEQDTILNELENNEEDLNKAIRTKAALTTLQVIDDISVTLSAQLADLEPNEAFKAYSSILTGLAALTNPPKANQTNINNGIMLSEGQVEDTRGKLIDLVNRLPAPSPPSYIDVRAEKPIHSEPLSARSDESDVRLGSVGEAGAA